MRMGAGFPVEGGFRMGRLVNLNAIAVKKISAVDPLFGVHPSQIILFAGTPPCESDPG